MFTNNISHLFGFALTVAGTDADDVARLFRFVYR